MYAETRTNILAHLGGIIYRRKFEDRNDFLGFVCDKEAFGFPYGELIACEICNAPWQGVAIALLCGHGVITGFALAGAWVISDLIIKRLEC